MRCTHCHARPATRPRRLCWRCYYTPAIRAMHAMKLFRSDGRVSRRGVQQPARVKPAAYPTHAEPGSFEKVRVLAERAELGQDLTHPLDPYFDGHGNLIRPLHLLPTPATRPPLRLAA